jgi:GNAT superfamily N-acetyltransferase
MFSNREVGALCIHHGHRLVHYSGFTPRYWRFPFLIDRDLQIGDTWTDPSHRGKGLASYALEEIMEIKQAPGREFWYVVGDTNFPSIRVVERAGFGLVGFGGWRKPWGIKLLGSYVMDLANGELLPVMPDAEVGTVPATIEVPLALVPARSAAASIEATVDALTETAAVPMEAPLAPVQDARATTSLEPAVVAADLMASVGRRSAA